MLVSIEMARTLYTDPFTLHDTTSAKDVLPCDR